MGTTKNKINRDVFREVHRVARMNRQAEDGSSNWKPFHSFPRAKLLRPLALRQMPMPNVPTQIVKFFRVGCYASFGSKPS